MEIGHVQVVMYTGELLPQNINVYLQGNFKSTTRKKNK